MLDRRRGGKTTILNGQEWTLPAQLGQMKTGQGGKERVRQKKRREDNNKERTGMDIVSSAWADENRTRWKGISTLHGYGIE